MPVFQETSNSARDLRILPSRALPLPRLSPIPSNASSAEETREVVVIGAGPSGLFLTLLLARYGITESSLLCLDAKPGTLKAGQADGLQPRTLEVFQSLGIAAEILADGCHMEEVAFWNPISQQSQVNGKGANGNGVNGNGVNGNGVNGNGVNGNGHKTGIRRTEFVPDVNVPARFPYEVTIHQGRIERILQENLHVYAPQDTVRRSHRFLEYAYDDTQSEFPILVKYEYDHSDGQVKQGRVRTKYLVGADGARSGVRRNMGLSLEGDTTDHIWGVCDFIADTNFPDIRKRCAVHSDAGSVMVIPRERIATGEYLTRLYVQVPGGIDTSSNSATDKKAADQKRRGAVTLDFIFGQARAVFAPYEIKVKEGTEPDWWAAYQIGQRMTPKFSARTPDGVDRVFIVGDACHTHSPKAGQGMNVSMMDSFNLAWKLAHSINGLTPRAQSGASDLVLQTFEQERVDTARQLIEFDTKFSHMFSGQIGCDDSSKSDLSHEEFLRVFREGSGFTSGCGLRYQPSTLVRPSDRSLLNASLEQDPLSGKLVAGTRLRNAEVKRYADANTRQIQDEVSPVGRYYMLVFASSDFMNKSGASQLALTSCINIIDQFPPTLISLAVLHPLSERFEWTDIPAGVKELAEMRVYGLSKTQDAYDIYGVPKEQGLIAIIRPDGYIGMLAPLSGHAQVQAYFDSCLVRV
ncbi:putative phenol monooxygenase [Phaeosphaeria sp. MPI-PUGE-AT-0046c]|nr:putative phenol monooxygenase [Phaeosphaeria sp. MPI-PUGE-AT-0046c]